MKDDHLTKHSLNKELLDEDTLRSEFYKIRKALMDFRMEMNQKFDMVLSAINRLAKQIADEKIKKVASEATFQRHERWLEEHDNRIGRLEKKIA